MYDVPTRHNIAKWGPKTNNTQMGTPLHLQTKTEDKGAHDGGFPRQGPRLRRVGGIEIWVGRPENKVVFRIVRRFEWCEVKLVKAPKEQGPIE